MLVKGRSLEAKVWGGRRGSRSRSTWCEPCREGWHVHKPSIGFRFSCNPQTTHRLPVHGKSSTGQYWEHAVGKPRDLWPGSEPIASTFCTGRLPLAHSTIWAVCWGWCVVGPRELLGWTGKWATAYKTLQLIMLLLSTSEYSETLSGLGRVGSISYSILKISPLGNIECGRYENDLIFTK